MSNRPRDKWEAEDWEPVLNRINTRECVPFLGAGASAGIFPLGAVIAQKLANKFNYPLPDTSDLIKVSQYVALKSDRKFVKEEVVRMLNATGHVEMKSSRNPYKQLARLPLPLYVTTNYDSLMYDALITQPPRAPRRDICRWNPLIAAQEPGNGGNPTAAHPTVFHLHGSKEDVESLVLTEDDYLDFLTEMLRNSNLLPEVVEEAITKSTVLFIGYSLADWTFRILFRQLSSYSISSIAVFPPPSGNDASKEKIQNYLKTYYGALRVKICWATAEEFMQELIERYTKQFGEKALI